MFNNKIILFTLFFLLCSLYAADDDINYCNTNLNPESISLLLIGLLISILFVSLFFMYGKFMGSPEVEGTYMVELQQIGLTIFMIFLITGGIEILCNVSLEEGGLRLSSSDNVFNSVRESQIKLMSKTMSFYTSLMNSVNTYSIMGSTQAGFGAKGFMVGYSPLSGGNFVAQTMAPVGQTVLIAYFAQAFQYALFEFSRSDIFLLLLPLGLVLRSFPISRKFGGVLIALVLGLSYLYPLFLNFGYIFVDIDGIKSITKRYAMPVLAAISISMIGLSYAATLAPQITFSVIGIIMGVMMATSSFGEMFGEGNQLGILGVFTLTGDYFFNDLNLMYGALGKIMLATFFIPALLILVLGAVVRSLSATIGTETDITGILRAV